MLTARALLGAYHPMYIAAEFIIVSVNKHMNLKKQAMANSFTRELRTRSVCKRAMFGRLILTYIQDCI